MNSAVSYTVAALSLTGWLFDGGKGSWAMEISVRGQRVLSKLRGSVRVEVGQ